MSLVGRAGRNMLSRLVALMAVAKSTNVAAMGIDGVGLGGRFGQKGDPYMKKFGRRPSGRGRNPFSVNGVNQGKQECARRMRQVVRGVLPISQLGPTRQDALATYQQIVQGFTLRKAA